MSSSKPNVNARKQIIKNLHNGKTSLSTNAVVKKAGSRDTTGLSIGFPETSDLGPTDFMDAYMRDVQANREINKLSADPFKEQPTFICEDESTREHLSLVYEQAQPHLQECLRMALIEGRSLIYMSLNDSEDIDQPVTGRVTPYSETRLVKYNIIPFSMVKEVREENDPTSPDYGEPTAYTIRVKKDKYGVEDEIIISADRVLDMDLGLSHI